MSDKLIIQTPVGRVINHSLWEKDAYKDERGREAKPQYKIELAFDPDDIEEFENKVVEAAEAKWGASAGKDYDDGKIRSPIIEGDVIADDREKRGKKGDAYRGKVVIRASTAFNKHGEDGPGGVYVCDENAEEIDFASRDKIYRGCYGIAIVELSPYTVDRQDGVTLYLKGFQFVKDGDRLSGDGVAGLFKPMAAPSSGGESQGRRRRG